MSSTEMMMNCIPLKISMFHCLIVMVVVWMMLLVVLAMLVVEGGQVPLQVS